LFGHNALRLISLEQLFSTKFNHKHSKIHTALDVKAAAWWHIMRKRISLDSCGASAMITATALYHQRWIRTYGLRRAYCRTHTSGRGSWHGDFGY
jgi:hypothetical protein